ncbi:hypothetical protein WA588_005757, partial [Blastocystis sp. NMH]
MQVNPDDVPLMTRYLRMKGTIKKSNLPVFLKIMGEMVFHGNQPQQFTELRTYYYLKSDRQDEILQFVERSNRTYSIVYRGMTFKRCDNLREGAGGEYSCSEEGGGYIQETGFTPVKKKSCVCRQWCVAPGIFLRVYDMKEGYKGAKKMQGRDDASFFELYSYCNSLNVESTGKAMRTIVSQLQPYLAVEQKKNI